MGEISAQLQPQISPKETWIHSLNSRIRYEIKGTYSNLD